MGTVGHGTRTPGVLEQKGRIIVQFGLFHSGIYCGGSFIATSAMEKSVFSREYNVLRKMLRESRETAKLTQVQLAERLGETQSFVSKCERGERRLDLVQLRAFCKTLGVSLPTFV